MKNIKIIFLTLMLFISVSAEIDTNSQHFYMYIYFVQGETEQAMGARLAFSTDATNWEVYDNEKPVIVPKIADADIPLMRDPNTYYDKNTGIFHLTWTTAWKQDNVGYATTKDFKNWSEQIMIPVGERIEGCKVSWAPEFFYDDIKDSMMLYWSTDRGICGKEAFYSMTKDFKHYTAPKLLFEPKTESGEKYSIIDGTIIKIGDGRYYLFYKDERSYAEAGKAAKNIHCTWGPTPQGKWWEGSWDGGSAPLTYAFTEGPTAFIVGDKLRLSFDPYGIGMHESTDRILEVALSQLQGEAPPSPPWTKGAPMKTKNGSFLPSHGSISEIPKAKLLQLLYNIEDKTTYQPWTAPKANEVYVDSIYVPPPEYPFGKQNCGCGSGVGLAFIPPIILKGLISRRRKKQNSTSK